VKKKTLEGKEETTCVIGRGERPIKPSWCQPLAIVQTIGTWIVAIHIT